MVGTWKNAKKTEVLGVALHFQEAWPALFRRTSETFARLPHYEALLQRGNSQASLQKLLHVPYSMAVYDLDDGTKRYD